MNLCESLADYGRQLTPPVNISDDWENADVRLAAIRFLHIRGGSRCHNIRQELLTACIDYAIPPNVFAEACRDAFLNSEAEQLFRAAVETDAALQLTWIANRVFWR